MIKRVAKRHKDFKNQTVITQIIGGKDDYCAERFAYKRETDGISPSMAFTSLATAAPFEYFHFARYFPLCGVNVIISKYGQFAEWSAAEPAKIVTKSAMSVNYPNAFPCIYKGEYVVAVVGGYSVVRVKTDGSVENTNAIVRVTSPAMHCGRVFGVDLFDKYKVRWSGYDITDWVELGDRSGYICLTPSLGKALDVHSYGGKVVVVRDFGLTVISTLGDFRHMRTEAGDTFRLPEVYANSSAICGGKLWIYTKSGMFVFDGATLTEAPFDGIMFDYVLSKPEVVDERYIYYTATKDDKNCLFEYDTLTGAGNPFADGCRVQFFGAEGAHCFRNNSIGSLNYGLEDDKRKWISKEIDLGVTARKTLKNITVTGSGNINITVDYDGNKLRSVGAGKKPLNVRGSKFTFTVTGNCKINGLTAEWEVSK